MGFPEKLYSYELESRLIIEIVLIDKLGITDYEYCFYSTEIGLQRL